MSQFSIARSVPLALHTTLQVGGNAEYFTEVSDSDALQAAVVWAKEQALSVTILGGGSNVLVADAGISGLVIKIVGGSCTYEESVANTVHVHAAAGMLLDDLVADTVARGYWGLENLSHIPGTVGAAPVQNVGAYGVELSDVIKQVTVFDLVTKQVEEWLAADCEFGYRQSRFKQRDQGRYVITQVTIQLQTTPQPRLQYGALKELMAVPNLDPSVIRQKVIAIRAGKFPNWRQVGTAGSFFMNPSVSATKAQSLRMQYPELPMYENLDGTVKVSLGWLLDHVCGLRGYRTGAVGLHTEQALVLVQYGGGSTSEVDRFATMVADTVFSKTGITITREVTALP